MPFYGFSMTLHKCKPDLTRMNGILNAIPLETSHTADILEKKILEFMEENDLTLSQIVAMIRDDAAVMKKLCELLGIDS